MLHPTEERIMLSVIDDIIYNIKHIDLKDLAYFLVKNERNDAENLADAINYEVNRHGY